MKIKYKKVKTLGEFIDIIRLRVEVFEIEQKCRSGLEPDENNKVAVQNIAILTTK